MLFLQLTRGKTMYSLNSINGTALYHHLRNPHGGQHRAVLMTPLKCLAGSHGGVLANLTRYLLTSSNSGLLHRHCCLGSFHFNNKLGTGHSCCDYAKFKKKRTGGFYNRLTESDNLKKSFSTEFKQFNRVGSGCSFAPSFSLLHD